MRKIVLFLIAFIFTLQITFAKNSNYSVNFNGEKYYLLYSVKNQDFGGYLNEYYKKGDTYNIWSEMIAVHHFPNAYSPIDRIKDFKDYLGSMHVPSSLTFDDKRNTAMIDFIMIADKNMPIVVEFNIFKYEKSKKCGSLAIQYAKRYTATTTMQIELIKKDIEKNRNKLISKIKNFEIPEIITEDIDKCISAAAVNEKAAEEDKLSEVNHASDNETLLEEVSMSEEQVENDDIVNTDLNDDKQTVVLKESESVVADSELDNTPEFVEQEKTSGLAEQQESDIKETSFIKKDEDIAEDKMTKISARTVDTENINKSDVNKEELAPIPDKATIDVNKKKKNKEINYEITNDKSEYIAVPRTKKEMKEEVKQNKLRLKNIKKQANQQIKQDKKDAKIKAKLDKKQAKQKKKDEKKAEKAAKKPYIVANDNSDLIAKPRTKKELKENNKKLKKQAKNKKKKQK